MRHCFVSALHPLLEPRVTAAAAVRQHIRQPRQIVIVVIFELESPGLLAPLLHDFNLALERALNRMGQRVQIRIAAATHPRRVAPSVLHASLRASLRARYLLGSPPPDLPLRDFPRLGNLRGGRIPREPRTY